MEIKIKRGLNGTANHHFHFYFHFPQFVLENLLGFGGIFLGIKIFNSDKFFIYCRQIF